jgi:hypothetical protein
MRITTKLTAITLLLGTMCFAQDTRAEPQDNFWLESEWATNSSGDSHPSVSLRLSARNPTLPPCRES